ncbi:MAG: FAD-binding protein, partial [Deltaproteobacteria bacterium]|nr:FAD-binding protein [Deltaproteobacteria bacterium]
MDHLRVEVLVIGCGAAGLRAAIAAREAGRQVIVVSKLPEGKGTVTVMSGGAFQGVGRDFGPERHRASTLAAGRGINQQDLVETLTSQAPARLEEMLGWGLSAEIYRGLMVVDGKYPALGAGLIRCLSGRAQELGVRFLAGLVVARMAFIDGLASVLAYSMTRSQWLGIMAKAVVLASGGASALYLRHDNPQRMMGEGYSLALEAGASLKDMEFSQCYPLVTAQPGLPMILIPPRLEILGQLANERGEDIHHKYRLTELPAAEKARDRLSQALFREVYVCRRQVTMDLTRIDKEAWCSHPFSAAAWDLLVRRCGALERPLPVAPAAHFFMGGVRIDSRGRTKVPGLFACGEVAGGVHGANRQGGNALTEAIVFGARAGQAAAVWAGQQPPAEVKTRPDNLSLTPPASGAGPARATAAEVKQRLKEVMWLQGGLWRSREGLNRAASTLARIRQEADRLSLSGQPGQVQNT